MDRVIYEGTQRAIQEGEETVRLTRKAMGLSGLWNRISHRGRQTMAREKKEAAE